VKSSSFSIISVTMCIKVQKATLLTACCGYINFTQNKMAFHIIQLICLNILKNLVLI
jgi:hypothetical protein